MEKYYKHKIENLLVINKIITVHYFEFNKNFISDGESHDFWELVYADKESVMCIADSEEIKLNQGEIFFHKPNEFHVLKANGKTAPNVFIITFECRSNAMNFFESKKITLKNSEKNRIYSIIDEAKHTFNMPISNPKTKKLELLKSPTLGGLQVIKNSLEILLINIMRTETETDGENKVFLHSGEYDNKLVNDVIKILEQNITKPLSIKEICEKISYSKSMLFKQFKSHTGKTVIEYFNILKIEKAKRFLRENNLSVKEISEMLSFDTPNYFSKKFKKVVGSTPLQYKKFTLSNLK